MNVKMYDVKKMVIIQDEIDHLEVVIMRWLKVIFASIIAITPTSIFLFGRLDGPEVPPITELEAKMFLINTAIFIIIVISVMIVGYYSKKQEELKRLYDIEAARTRGVW